MFTGMAAPTSTDPFYDFECRAECVYDALVALKQLYDTSPGCVLYFVNILQTSPLQACDVRFTTRLSLSVIQDTWRAMLNYDLHTMVQTLSVEGEYKGECFDLPAAL